jgi:hypothetical protein
MVWGKSAPRIGGLMRDELLKSMERMLHQYRRGIRTAEELVDGVFGDLAYENCPDLVDLATRRLLDVVPEAAVAGFLAWVEGRLTSPPRLMIYADSRAVYQHST